MPASKKHKSCLFILLISASLVASALPGSPHDYNRDWTADNNPRRPRPPRPPRDYADSLRRNENSGRKRFGRAEPAPDDKIVEDFADERDEVPFEDEPRGAGEGVREEVDAFEVVKEALMRAFQPQDKGSYLQARMAEFGKAAHTSSVTERVLQSLDMSSEELKNVSNMMHEVVADHSKLAELKRMVYTDLRRVTNLTAMLQKEVAQVQAHQFTVGAATKDAGRHIERVAGYYWRVSMAMRVVVLIELAVVVWLAMRRAGGEGENAGAYGEKSTGLWSRIFGGGKSKRRSARGPFLLGSS